MSRENEINGRIYIGVDIGTESVGYALTDESYKVPQKCGKPLMGVRLFDEAQTAEERRVFRANKVRGARAKMRITLLKELFDKYINEVDPLFFIRLECSGFWADDKKMMNEGLATLDSLFAGAYSDKHYHKEFKTIYHLRRFLCDEKNWMSKKPDIRLLYLACHHLLKARGHFLYEGLDASASDEFKAEQAGKILFEKLNEYLEQESDTNETHFRLLFKLANFADVEAIAKNDKLYLRDKKEKLIAALCPKEFSKSELKRADAMVRAFLGSKVKITDIFTDYESEDAIKDFNFSGDFEKQEPELMVVLGDDFELINLLKNIYDWIMLMRLLKGKNSISDSMIEIHENHKRQLDELKKLVNQKAEKGTYYKIFRSNKEAHNYAAYIGSNLNSGKAIIKKCKQEDFYGFLKKQLGDILTDEIKLEIANGLYLQKLRSKDNATIPHQLHKAELNRILANAVKFRLIDNDIAEKTLSIIKFRVPYYVGRLNPYYKQFSQDKSHHVWIEKRIEGVKITPWNFNEVVDCKKSNESFIGRMLSQCTYLRGETVLPKNSLIYSKFTVLNELNNLKINGEPISVAEKQRIFNSLFKTQKIVTIAKLSNFLGGGITKSDITGIDIAKGSFNASYSSYIEAKKVFGEEIESEKIQKIIEDVILWHSVHTDKKLVEDSIKEKYPHLDELIVRKLKSLNFSGFGNLSKKFLTAHKCCEKSTGLMTSIMDMLWNTNQNLMEIIHDFRYNVEEWIGSENFKDGEVFDYSIVEASYASPSVKRSVWQTMLVVDELIELNGGRKPDKIFIEVTRNKRLNKDNGRKVTRKKLLEEKFAGIKTLENSLKDELTNLPDDALRGEKLFLYFLQCGKCAYSGERINISDLLYDSKNSLYDVDHIIPQSLKKDDSLTNKVLVKRLLNAKKDKNYPLNRTREIWDKKEILIPMWEEWNNKGLIKSETLARLKRTTPLSEKELEGFIARQLVFTGQSATVVADLFKRKYENAEIVYSKAENISEFRKKFDLLKCRDVNDHHHAHDAYLNIVVGNTYNQRFNHQRKFYIEKYADTDKSWMINSQQHIFEYDVAGAFISGKWENGKQIEKGETEKIIERYLSLKYLPISKRTHENKGAFYNQNADSSGIHQKDILTGKKTEKDLNVNNLIPIKGSNNPISDVKKYGGYKSLRPAYFMIVEYKDKKDQWQREFISVSLLDKKRWEKLTLAEQEIELSEKFGTPTKIVLKKILLMSLFELYGMQCRLSTGNKASIFFHNAKQFFVDKESSNYIRIIAKYNQRVKDKKIELDDYVDKTDILISGKENGHQIEHRLTKTENLRLWSVILEKLKRLYGGAEDIRHDGKSYHGLYDRIIKHEKLFTNISITRQIKILTSLIIGLGCNANEFDLSELGDKKFAMKISAGVKINYPLTLIKQSVTGIKEKRIQLYPFNVEV